MLTLKSQGRDRFKVTVYGTGAGDGSFIARDGQEAALAVGHVTGAPHGRSLACPVCRVELARRELAQKAA